MFDGNVREGDRVDPPKRRTRAPRFKNSNWRARTLFAAVRGESAGSILSRLQRRGIAATLRKEYNTLTDERPVFISPHAMNE